MNPSDRQSFEAFCNALQYFPVRLVERPRPPTLGIAHDFVPYNRDGNTFVNRRRQNFWSIVHIGVHGPFPLNLKGTKGNHSGATKKIVVYRFQLRYADIPIEPIIELVEPYLDPTSESPTIQSKVASDIRSFNTRVAEAARAVLGSRRLSWPRSPSWLQDFHFP
ncbi:hypothetical protein Clacol_005372 [Clathrus columnatus]|uniref:Uncharacterized protein n=1 Tax=Clathrus columnatus TaxID=1419009 RepID=A0AAV5ADR4_9AGAM|nr:hypothetical protein Clacol_005372 [Clathrus columnatus]